MELWKIEMINTIMRSDKDICETIAAVIDATYEDETVYMDELATQIAAYDMENAEELKDYLENEVEVSNG